MTTNELLHVSIYIYVRSGSCVQTGRSISRLCIAMAFDPPSLQQQQQQQHSKHPSSLLLASHTHMLDPPVPANRLTTQHNIDIYSTPPQSAPPLPCPTLTYIHPFPPPASHTYMWKL
ncbi:hypothetical protein ACJQWK_00046 [Exserohilum turcicum]